MTENQKILINDSGTQKNIRLTFPNHEINDIEDNRVYLDGMSLEESLFDGDNLTFGKCNASLFKIKVADFTENIKDAEMDVYVTFANPDTAVTSLTVPFGKYIVQSAERTSDRRWRDITAIDFMSKFDVDIADWYNSTLYPTSATTHTIAEIRTALCQHIGVTQASVNLINDSLVIGKTIEPSSLNARDLLQNICEINGVFGHFDWNGVLQYITLEITHGLYPAVNLYPSTSLFPRRATADSGVVNETVATFKSCDYKDYDIEQIDSVGILKEDGSLAVHYDANPNYKNRYNIVGNVLLYGFNTSQLQTIAQTIYNKISNCQYKPNKTVMYSGIYMPLGQPYSVNSRLINEDTIVDTSFSSILLKRQINGIQAMFQTLEADGGQYQPDISTNDVLTEIKIQKGKSAKYERDLEHLSLEFADFEAETEAQFVITANKIESTVAKTQNIWLEEQPIGTAITIKYRGYGSPVGKAFSYLSVGDLYLNVDSGYVYKMTDLNNQTWTYQYTLTTTQSHTETQISQTNNQIVLKADANGNMVLVELGANPSTGTSFTVKADDISLEGKTIDLTADDITIQSKHFNVDEFGNTHIEGDGVLKIMREYYPGSDIGYKEDVTSDYASKTYKGRFELGETLPAGAVNQYLVVMDVYDRNVQGNYIMLSGNGNPNTVMPASESTYKKRYIDLTTGIWYYCGIRNQTYYWGAIGECGYLSDIGSIREYDVNDGWVQSTDIYVYPNTSIFDIDGSDGLTIRTPQFNLEDGNAELKGSISIAYGKFSVDEDGNMSVNDKLTIDNQGNLDINGRFSVDKNGNATAKSLTVDGGTINGSEINGSEITGADIKTDTLNVKDTFNIYYVYEEEGEPDQEIIAGTFSGHSNGGDIQTNVLDIYTDYLTVHAPLSASRVVSNGYPVIVSYGNEFDDTRARRQISSFTYVPAYTDPESGGYAHYLEIYANNTVYGIRGDLWQSDTKLKENIKESDINALERINQIDVVSFDWKETKGHEEIGLSANQLQKIIPSAVYEVKQTEKSEYDSIKQIDSKYLTIHLIKAVQELTEINEQQQNKINNLKEELATLKEQVAFLMGKEQNNG